MKKNKYGPLSDRSSKILILAHGCGVWMATLKYSVLLLGIEGLR
jgi:hypothetical protein